MRSATWRRHQTKLSEHIYLVEVDVVGGDLAVADGVDLYERAGHVFAGGRNLATVRSVQGAGVGALER
jgi:hypothetical protein